MKKYIFIVESIIDGGSNKVEAVNYIKDDFEIKLINPNNKITATFTSKYGIKRSNVELLLERERGKPLVINFIIENNQVNNISSVEVLSKKINKESAYFILNTISFFISEINISKGCFFSTYKGETYMIPFVSNQDCGVNTSKTWDDLIKSFH